MSISNEAKALLSEIGNSKLPVTKDQLLVFTKEEIEDFGRLANLNKDVIDVAIENLIECGVLKRVKGEGNQMILDSKYIEKTSDANLIT